MIHLYVCPDRSFVSQPVLQRVHSVSTKTRAVNHNNYLLAASKWTERANTPRTLIGPQSSLGRVFC